MSTARPLPKLAAMFLTEGHRVPEELLPSPARDAGSASGTPPHPLDAWECPLDGARQFGQSAAGGALPLRPPEY
jgi:hypothetical protein